MFLPQFFGSSASDSTSQSSAPADSLISVIHEVIRDLEDDHTHKELSAEASQAEERPLVVAQECHNSCCTTGCHKAAFHIFEKVEETETGACV
jgi:hypothetical protein